MHFAEKTWFDSVFTKQFTSDSGILSTSEEYYVTRCRNRRIVKSTVLCLYSQDPSLNDWLVTPTNEKTVLTERGKNASYKYGHYIAFRIYLVGYKYTFI